MIKRAQRGDQRFFGVAIRGVLARWMGRLGIGLVLWAVGSTTAFGQLWTPSNITTIAWYDASDASTILPASGTVTDWLDKSTNNWTMIGGDGPQTGARTINGMNVMDMSGSRAHFGCDNFPVPSSGDVSIFMLTAIDAVNYADACAWSMIDSSNGNKWWRLAPGTNTQFNGVISSKNLSGLALNMTGGPYDGRTNIFVSVFDYTATNVSVYVDGTNEGSNSSYTAKAGGSHTFYLFRGVAGTASRVAPAGAIAEVILVEDCSTETRQLVEGYLAWKWGLVDNLPADHRYKSNAPGSTIGTVILIQ